MRCWLLPNLLLGAGVGLALPTLSSATAASLPSARFAMGSAVFSTARQFGAVLGVALLIAVLGTPALDSLLASFQRSYLVCLLLAAASGLICLAMGRPRLAKSARL